MCWNQNVSLNTFIFSMFVLLLIAYNNTYTQYKTPIFNNKFVYFFFISFITMQLIEFFLWRNIDNKKINNLLSMIGALLLLIQPIASLLMLKDDSLKYKLILSIDNCFCTPYLQKPALYGADMIIHSATKYIDGQGRVIGGVILGKKELIKDIRFFARHTGPSLSPFNSWVLSKSLEKKVKK